MNVSKINHVIIVTKINCGYVVKNKFTHVIKANT
jgi:hypothetical protein